MTTAGVMGAAGPPVPRVVAVVVLGLGMAAGAAAITMLSLIMRSVTAVGGSCADGGSYLPAQPCPSGTGTALLLVFAGAITCLVGTLWATSVLDAPLPLLLAWPALFLTLGWNFLEDGVDPLMGEDAAVGHVVCGVVFVLMGAGPLVLRAWTRCGRAAEAKPPAPAPVAARPASVPLPRPRSADIPRAAAPSVASRLERLAALHTSGELTDEEYARAELVTLHEEPER